VSGLRVGGLTRFDCYNAMMDRSQGAYGSAYRSGWLDGCYAPMACFTENRRLAEWKSAFNRLEYCRARRVGFEARERRECLLELS
jgi:hypothetical protein